VKTVVLGGYGNFGARICRALAHWPGIELVVAGRNKAKAAAMAAECGATSAVIDIHDPQLTQVLSGMGAGLVIHTAGPFQEQGYAVAQASARAGAHYIDLADGRRFVCDFHAALHSDFRRNGKLGITGASTVPALSSAVINALTAGWDTVADIDICIAPAQTAPRGVATMAAVLGYCGAPIQVWDGGRWNTRHGWEAPATVSFKRLQPRLGALCDIPDLELFPANYAGSQSVMFRAALEVGISQRGLALLGALRRRGIVKHPQRFAAFLNRAAGWLDPFGSALGGMVVRLEGSHDGQRVQAEWHIAADDDHGPEIPCMAAVLLARKIAAGDVGDMGGSGAMTSMNLLTLAEFEPEFAKWKMVTDHGA
jgi:saccharopine dehydrogenase-like NADP-dependent oxidoreductase